MQGEHEEKHDAEPETRHGHREQGRDHGAVVEVRPRTHRGQGAKRDPDRDRQAQADQRQAHRVRERLADQRGHPLVSPERAPEVAVERPPEEEAELHRQWAVEPELVANAFVGVLRRHTLRPGPPALGHHEQHRIAWQEVEHREHQE
jgi:hypothetical protein